MHLGNHYSAGIATSFSIGCKTFFVMAWHYLFPLWGLRSSYHDLKMSLLQCSFSWPEWLIVSSLWWLTLLFFRFTLSFVTWVTRMVSFSTADWIFWKYKFFASSLNVKWALKNFFVAFLTRLLRFFMLAFRFFIWLAIIPNCFKNIC